MVHTRDCQDIAQQTRPEAVQTLKSLAFCWNDVEDVFTASDINYYMLRAIPQVAKLPPPSQRIITLAPI